MEEKGIACSKKSRKFSTDPGSTVGSLCNALSERLFSTKVARYRDFPQTKKSELRVIVRCTRLYLSALVHY